MSNFGCRSLRLVNPYKLAFRDARSAVRGADVLKTAHESESVAEAVSDCTLVIGTTAVGMRSVAQTVRFLDDSTGRSIRSSMQDAKVALLFGSEKTGLSNRDFSYCNWLLKIPTSDQNISMNLGQAVAVCLYELARGPHTQLQVEDANQATAGELEKITECLLESLRISGYVKPGTDEMFEKKARQLIRGMDLKAYDAKLFLGMLRQMLWKLRLPPKN